MSNEEMKNTCVNKPVLAKTGNGHCDSRYNLQTPNPHTTNRSGNKSTLALSTSSGTQNSALYQEKYLRLLNSGLAES